MPTRAITVALEGGHLHMKANVPFVHYPEVTMDRVKTMTFTFDQGREVIELWFVDILEHPLGQKFVRFALSGLAHILAELGCRFELEGSTVEGLHWTTIRPGHSVLPLDNVVSDSWVP
ncbi:MAG: hypothetical protein IT324_13875 [Anaerolineae bacterium]|nr:hypothetical protein [Anaerolineae bacterium]